MVIDWAARVQKHASSGPSKRFWPFRGCHEPGDRYPNRRLKTQIWTCVVARGFTAAFFTFIETILLVGPLLSTTLAASENLRLCLQRRRVQRHRGPILARKRWASGSERQPFRAAAPVLIRAHQLQSR